MGSHVRSVPSCHDARPFPEIDFSDKTVGKDRAVQASLDARTVRMPESLREGYLGALRSAGADRRIACRRLRRERRCRGCHRDRAGPGLPADALRLSARVGTLSCQRAPRAIRRILTQRTRARTLAPHSPSARPSSALAAARPYSRTRPSCRAPGAASRCRT
jgi:hypothetical protein